MSLRDHFAGLAMQEHYAHLSRTGQTVSQCHDEIVSEAYRLSDKMLAARQPQAPGSDER